MKNVFSRIPFSFSLIVIICFTAIPLKADDAHYKNMLVGERAATMGGTYVAISDDSTGCYYNPAGIAYAVGDSLSGSGNVLHKMKTVYSETIGTKDWVRESEALVPNYFGVLKKYKSYSFCFSYVVPEAFIEHQDLVFDYPLSTVKKYYQSLHSEDITYLMGPSAAIRFGDDLSLGLTLYYQYRSFMRQYHYFLASTDGSYQINYQSQKLREDGLMPKIGMQWSPWNLLTVGMAVDQSFLVNSSYQSDASSHLTDNSSGTANYNSLMFRSISEEKRKFPLHFAWGIAYFPTPSLLYTIDLDYYQAQQKGRADIVNYSGGTEYYLNPTNAVRFGLFTNYTNLPQPDSSTIAPFEYIDIYGASFGYTSYSSSSSLTLGAVYTSGSGKAWLYDGSTESKNMTRDSLTLLFSASSSL
ncbi:MAG: aromatic hydrocarbon degradation protein [SAR324 cluster bacterium]|nr:aromatic hydrocarbon degradation protein [SAR324 cluster bacterium]MBL7035181.1 aromatic hydrocarbon degradation protein [SAR324 cluster bacterium]